MLRRRYAPRMVIIRRAAIGVAWAALFTGSLVVLADALDNGNPAARRRHTVTITQVGQPDSKGDIVLLTR